MNLIGAIPVNEHLSGSGLHVTIGTKGDPIIKKWNDKTLYVCNADKKLSKMFMLIDLQSTKLNLKPATIAFALSLLKKAVVHLE